MIKSDFSKYFTSQDALDSIRVTEIESLIAEAPSSDLYRLLLVNKMNGLHLHDAALMSSDRLLLEDIVHGKYQQVTVLGVPKNSTINHIVSAPVFQEEVLIEAEISGFNEATNQLKVEQEAIEESDKETSMVEIQIENIPGDVQPQIKNAIVDAIQITEDVNKDASSRSIDHPIPAIESDALESTSDIKSNHPKEHKSKKYKLQEYSGLSEYALWLMSFKHDNLDKKIKKEEKKAQKRLLEASAQKSVTKSNEIISESLAKILEKQGHLDDAKKMYEQLMHKYPEKSRYFAAQIDKLLKSL